MSCSIRIRRSAARELGHVPRRERERLVEAIDALAEHPFSGNALKGGLRGLRRIRMGDYRVVYEVQEDALVVLVVRIAHRRDAYRRATR